MRKRNGFTLIEIMFAMAILAIVSVVLLKSSVQSVSRAGLIQDRTMARWIAENQLHGLRMIDRDDEDNYPSVGVKRSTITMANRDWQIVLDVSETENDLIRRIEVSVFKELDPDVALSTLTGFIGRY